MKMKHKNILILALISILTIQVVLAAGYNGGGGSGGSSPDLILSYSRLSDERSFRESTTYKIRLSNSDEYKFRISSIASSELDVTMELSTTANILIKRAKLIVDETQSFDLDNDGNNDLSIKLIAASGSLARFEFTDITGLLVNQPLPVEEPELKCGNLGTLRERVECRIELSEYDLDTELTLEYLPEECRAISNEGLKSSCIQRYKSVQQCWQQPIGPSRISCVKRQFNLGDIKSEKATCLASNPDNKDTCLLELEDKVYSLVKFRIYDLEERAEELLERGANEDVVVTLVTDLEGKKLEFNEAGTIEDKKNVIREVKTIWREFILKVKDQIN